MRKTNILRELSKVNPLINEETNFQTILELISSKSEIPIIILILINLIKTKFFI